MSTSLNLMSIGVMVASCYAAGFLAFAEISSYFNSAANMSLMQASAATLGLLMALFVTESFLVVSFHVNGHTTSEIMKMVIFIVAYTGISIANSVLLWLFAFPEEYNNL